MTTEWGTPITVEQFCWFVLKEINSPVVGNLEMYSTVGCALAHCKKDEVYQCLSSGEKRLVSIALDVWNARSDQGIGRLMGLDPARRRKVWIALGYLLLGRDIFSDRDLESEINWSGLKTK